METKINALNPNELKVQAFNPEQRTEIESLKRSGLLHAIKEHGILIPLAVVATLEGEGYEVADGHRRRQCALELGITEVPCIIYDRELLPTLYGECARTKRQLNGSETLFVWSQNPEMIAPSVKKKLDRYSESFGRDLVLEVLGKKKSFRFFSDVERLAAHFDKEKDQEWINRLTAWMFRHNQFNVLRPMKGSMWPVLSEIEQCLESDCAVPQSGAWSFTDPKATVVSQ